MTINENGENDGAAGLDNSGNPANMRKFVAPEMAMSLGKYQDGDFITKAGLAEVFGCTERTLQRMVERLDIPPPMLLAGRKVWIVGKLRAWIARAAERREAEALKAAGRLRMLDI